ncbi:PREDICTED: isoaspartyl peptidase/L-asparaginase-like [Chinchilla lanigera]|uniref:isoaspartyl peptidase/L-asparaginase-like n=1 Tax=Chinchilla lanigera TaxID=34839 RepID=UPI000697AD7C|nr:PREDICTED: isoaspartyl peptidase/L-asparaginase-like [Chinchilla lanigera]
MEPVLVVHGGSAGCVSCERRQRVRQGVIRAASLGHGVLRAGGSAVDAVEAAVAALEDDPEFNAGRGSVLTTDGHVEMDASIMDGRELGAGAVSAVRCIANPIKLARLVMDKTPHCFLTDQGAAKFAADMGVQKIPEEQLVTERSRKHLEKEKREKGALSPDCPKNLGTVGAVALDCKGNVAYATSTGGIVNKMTGRVGDSPCMGRTVAGLCPALFHPVTRAPCSLHLLLSCSAWPLLDFLGCSRAGGVMGSAAWRGGWHPAGTLCFLGYDFRTPWGRE